MRRLVFAALLVALIAAGVFWQTRRGARAPRATPELDEREKTSAPTSEPQEKQRRTLFRGRVLDEAGAAVDAAVALHTALRVQVARTTTDDAGRFQVAVPPRRPLRCLVSAEGFLARSLEWIEVAEGETVEREMRLPRGRQIRGRVVDTDGTTRASTSTPARPASRSWSRSASGSRPAP